MSLRLRLTLLYSTYISVILLIFGITIYGFISFTLINQLDNTLEGVAKEIINTASINSMGDLNIINLPELDIATNVYIQVWNNEGQVVASSPRIGGVNIPLDPIGFQSDVPIYNDSIFQNAHFRVLSVALLLGNREVGILQVGVSLKVVDVTQDNLLSTMFVIAVAGILFASLGSWIVLGRALSPLATIGDTVDQINRADDLSRRIPLRGKSDDEVGYLALSLNQTLERLEKLFESQQRLLADVSHELRTPLTVIKGNVDLMRRIKITDDDILNGIDDEVGRLNRLVGGLLLLAQAESGELALSFGQVELDLLLTEVFTEVRVLAGNKVKVHLNDIDEVIVYGDRDRLKQVLLNLIANAIQYTPPGGEVFLSLSKIASQCRLIVRDTGAGIPADDLPHIFDRFYRAEKSRTRSKSSGFGLGLSIAKWIIERHGGQIKVESKEGEGTTFAIWLNVMK
ncbi:MAG: two-component sensor histidine kinase [Chloroflexi bacterium OLB14]|nr:MAG: two-component sensor histidine kinase [Chloroflexi bacterium OLB14]